MKTIFIKYQDAQGQYDEDYNQITEWNDKYCSWVVLPEYEDAFDSVVQLDVEAVIESEDLNVLQDEELHIETNYVRDDLELEADWLELEGD